MSAKSVLSVRSVTSMRSTVASRSVMIFFRRSWVIGRAILMPSSSVAIAVASSRPIQIGRFSLLAGSVRMTMGVFVTGSRVRPPTVMRMKFSPLMLAPIVGHSRQKVSGGQSPKPCDAGARASHQHQSVDHFVELVQVAALLDDVAVREVAIHLAVAESPRHLVLRVEPDELFRALLDLLQHPLVREIVVVARVTEDDHGRVARDRRQVVAMEESERTPEVGVRIDVDHVAADRLVDRLVDLVLLEELGDLADVGDEDERAHLRV